MQQSLSIVRSSLDGSAPENDSERCRLGRESANARLPRLVICAGLPRSGSTWLYNAALMLLKSCTTAIGIFSDSVPSELGEHLKSNHCVVIKCHRPDPNLLAVGELVGAPLVLSVRDPRDCVVSWERAFRTPRPDALSQLRESAAALVKLSEYGRQLLVRYEEANDQHHILRALAAHLGVSASPELIERIGEELSIERVRESIASWEAEGFLDVDRAAAVWTEETHWHANHCGDGASGKYLDYLSSAEAAAVSNSLKPFFDLFQYAPSPPPALQPGDLLEFSNNGLAYAVDGFSFLESWGAWTDQTTALIILPLASEARRLQLEIGMIRAPCFGAQNGIAEAHIFVNGRKVTDLFANHTLPGELVLIYDGDAACDRVEIEFRFENLASPQSLGINSDVRLLGIGVRTLKVNYQ